MQTETDQNLALHVNSGQQLVNMSWKKKEKRLVPDVCGDPLRQIAALYEVSISP